MDTLALTKDEILAALVEAYIPHYEVYERRSSVAKDLIADDQCNAHQVVSRLASRKSDFLDGFQAAAEALGISHPEFLEAVRKGVNA